ncbi:hypothetical protein BTO32_15370 [Marinobacter lutaoensis]|uniref:Uncharacterized protein n=1 Tax=Marinobacter lutaoensis TaxID=135739 RepID=A0A1V2DPM8_9GAMM|nr:hypothetical protein [Marinobacter lutaoensis]ONF42585.1 hypothetical protein BTO32_15370 [Marinobacter lutaoensis]
MTNEQFLLMMLAFVALTGVVLAIHTARRLEKTKRCLLQMKHDIKSHAMEKRKSPEPKDLVVSVNKALVAAGHSRPDATEGSAT